MDSDSDNERKREQAIQEKSANQAAAEAAEALGAALGETVDMTPPEDGLFKAAPEGSGKSGGGGSFWTNPPPSTAPKPSESEAKARRFSDEDLDVMENFSDGEASEDLPGISPRALKNSVPSSKLGRFFAKLRTELRPLADMRLTVLLGLQVVFAAVNMVLSLMQGMFYGFLVDCIVVAFSVAGAFYPSSRAGLKVIDYGAYIFFFLFLLSVGSWLFWVMYFIYDLLTFRLFDLWLLFLWAVSGAVLAGTLYLSVKQIQNQKGSLLPAPI